MGEKLALLLVCISIYGKKRVIVLHRQATTTRADRKKGVCVCDP